MPLYGKLYRRGENAHYWAFIFPSETVYDATQALLDSVKNTKVSKYKFKWTWERWRLESVGKLTQFPKNLRDIVKISEQITIPNDLINRIERIHQHWDELIPEVSNVY